MQIEHGAELFQFRSFTDWVNHAQSRFARMNAAGVMTRETVCVDASGRICSFGKQFMSARDREAFPVTVYHIDPTWAPPVEVPHA